MPMLEGMTPEAWCARVPVLGNIARKEDALWLNPDLRPLPQALEDCGFTEADVDDAAARLDRFAPYIASAFPETRPARGRIESPLHPAPRLQKALEAELGLPLGRLLLKLDSHLPISGSIKARGGIYEVLQHAEALALKSGRLALADDYARLDTPEFREFFSGYSIAVGSTGNLGLSIGIMSAKLGFKVTVHMSADARQWKKDLLRSKGVTVVEYDDDYSAAVKAGRELAEADPKCHFVDDEHSRALFLGYAVAGRRVAAQFAEQGLVVDRDHPLFAYLPCGVGGGPSGVAFGLKLAFGDNAHCFFAEPALAPAVILGLATGLDDGISDAFFGLDTHTAADGLAVGRPSGLACRAMRHMLDGCFTMQDDALFRHLSLIAETEQIRLEPSAVAGVSGLAPILRDPAYAALPQHHITHLIWATGGSMVPPAEWERYNAKGQTLRHN